MPEGQFSGERKTYEYTDDLGNVYLLTLDATLGDLTDNGLTEATETTTGTPAPKRFEPRVVFWQGTLSGKSVRKQLVCGDPNAPLYGLNVAQALTIDGVAGFTTGRKGEKLSFLKLASATP